MQYVVTKEQLIVLEKHIQSLIDSAIDSIREESEDWGLGEMDELDEIGSIVSIRINRMTTHTRLTVYVDIYVNSDRDDFDNTLAELQYRIADYFPSIVFHLNEIIGSDN